LLETETLHEISKVLCKEIISTYEYKTKPSELTDIQEVSI